MEPQRPKSQLAVLDRHTPLAVWLPRLATRRWAAGLSSFPQKRICKNTPEQADAQ